MKIDLDDLERKARAVIDGADTFIENATRHHELELASPPKVLVALVARIRRLEVELARASGIARAKGETAYADDFMRVAQDREDFDEEIKR